MSAHDVWAYQGLGQSALRVWAMLPDHPGSDVFSYDDPALAYDDDSITHVGMSAADLVAETGLSRRTVDTALKRLFHNCLAVELPGKPHRWLRAAYPPMEALAAAIGCAGTIAGHIDGIERRQHANRLAYPSAYRAKHSLPEGMTA